MSWKRRYVVRRQQPPGSVMKSTWRSSSATPAGSSPVSADGSGAIAASCRTSGWSQVSAARASRLGSSPQPKPRRRPAGAHRPSTTPTPFRPAPCTSRTATNAWVELRTSHQERTSSGTANAYNPPQSAPMVRAEPPGCDVPAAASTLAVEDQADSVRPTDIEVVADDLFEEHPVIDRCVE